MRLLNCDFIETWTGVSRKMLKRGAREKVRRCCECRVDRISGRVSDSAQRRQAVRRTSCINYTRWSVRECSIPICVGGDTINFTWNHAQLSHTSTLPTAVPCRPAHPACLTQLMPPIHPDARLPCLPPSLRRSHPCPTRRAPRVEARRLPPGPQEAARSGAHRLMSSNLVRLHIEFYRSTCMQTYIKCRRLPFSLLAPLRLAACCVSAFLSAIHFQVCTSGNRFGRIQSNWVVDTMSNMTLGCCRDTAPQSLSVWHIALSVSRDWWLQFSSFMDVLTITLTAVNYWYIITAHLWFSILWQAF